MNESLKVSAEFNYGPFSLLMRPKHTLRCSQNGTHFYVRNNTCHKDFWRDFTNHSLYFELFEVWYIAGYYSISSIKCLWLRKYYWMRHKLRKSKHYASREVCADNDMESQPELTPLKSSHIFHGLTTNDLSCWRGRRSVFRSRQFCFPWVLLHTRRLILTVCFYGK